MTRRPKRRHCLTPGCRVAVKSCGLCPNCHQACARMIRAGLATEREMIEAGLMLPPTFRGQRMGRPPAAFRSYALRTLERLRRRRMPPYPLPAKLP